MSRFFSSRTPRRAAATALAGLALLPVAGCGGDEESAAAGDGLAGLAPASSVFYVEGAIRPEGDRKSDVDALIGKFSPGTTMEELVTKAFAESEVDYRKDVAPWLGERAALAVTGVPAGERATPDVAAILETKDAEKALAFLRTSAEGPVQEGSYDGTDFLRDPEDQTVGAIVDDTLVVGTEPAFKAVVDAAKGDGLAGEGKFSEVVDAVDEDALGIAWGDIRRALEVAGRASAGSVEAEQLEGVRELLDRQGVSTFAAGMVAGADGMEFRGAAKTKGEDQGDAAADVVAGLPSGSWAAAGLGDIGKALSDALDSVKSLSGPGFDVQRGLEQLSQQAGLDVQRDLLSWMGQAGIFVRGSSLTDIGGALVVRSKDTAATKAMLSKARTLAAGAGAPPEDLSGNGIDDGFSVSPAGSPVGIFAALAGDRFILAVNREALDEAVQPTGKLEDDEAYKAAQEQLGDDLRPTFFLDFPKVNGLLGLAAQGEPGFAEVKPYLDKITTIAAGSKRDGDLQRQSLVVGVR